MSTNNNSFAWNDTIHKLFEIEQDTMEGINMKQSYYLNDDGTLKDDRVIEDLHKAIDMYENGEIIETHDVLSYIVNAIRKCVLE